MSCVKAPNTTDPDWKTAKNAGVGSKAMSTWALLLAFAVTCVVIGPAWV